MSNDPSNFFMIDGPLAPQGNVESRVVSLRRRPESVTAVEVMEELRRACREYCANFEKNMPIGSVPMRPFEVGRVLEEIELAVANICHLSEEI